MGADTGGVSQSPPWLGSQHPCVPLTCVQMTPAPYPGLDLGVSLGLDSWQGSCAGPGPPSARLPFVHCHSLRLCGQHCRRGPPMAARNWVCPWVDSASHLRAEWTLDRAGPRCGEPRVQQSRWQGVMRSPMAIPAPQWALLSCSLRLLSSHSSCCCLLHLATSRASAMPETHRAGSRDRSMQMACTQPE